MSVVNYKLGPWERNDLGDIPRAKVKAKSRDRRDWKNQVQEELEEMTENINDDSIYIIVNEFVTKLAPEVALREDVSFWRSANAAWEELNEIAKDLGIDLEPDAEEFKINPTRGSSIIMDSYYIEERSFSG